MGCGGSKSAKVQPKDKAPQAEESKKDAEDVKAEVPETKTVNDTAAADDKTDDDVETVPMKLGERATSFVIAIDDPNATKKKMPKRLERLKKKEPLTKEQLEEKQRQADERRQQELEAKVAAAEESDRRREEIRSNSASNKQKRAQKIDQKLQEAADKKQERLEEIKKKGEEEDKKAEKVRARRHQVAIEEAAKLETGGGLGEKEPDGDSGTDVVLEEGDKVEAW